jgi:hypothetical protein
LQLDNLGLDGRTPVLTGSSFNVVVGGDEDERREERASHSSSLRLPNKLALRKVFFTFKDQHWLRSSSLASSTSSYETCLVSESSSERSL